MKISNLLLPTLALCLSALLPLSGNAETISDATYLRKLSFHLRGYQPKANEYDELQASSNHQAFLEAKIREYISSPDHAERMLFRLSNKFALQTPAYRANQTERFKADYGYIANNSLQLDAMSDLFRRMGRENLSWDQLLLASRYNLFVPTANAYYQQGFGSDFSFLQYVQPTLAPYAVPTANPNYDPKISPLSGKTLPIEFADDDQRIAGALTTNRFGMRYRNSALNKNRRRAAAVFRIFLCDSMSQGFVQDVDKKEDHLDAVFETDGTLTEAQLRENLKNSSAEAAHGKLKACVGCHYKLDPMGKTFQSMTESLYTEASPGALAFKHKDGSPVNIPVEGIRGLAKAIVQQPEYLNCQVDWFWKEFIGTNVPLTTQRRDELIQNFNSVGRRTNDFITVLLQAPEFRQRPEALSYVTFATVQPLLKRCDSCHDSGSSDAPPFGKMPYMDGGQDQTNSWLTSMSRRLNLPIEHKDHMPRHSEEWNPADIQLIKDWLASGAHDEKGQAHLSPANAASTQIGGSKP